MRTREEIQGTIELRKAYLKIATDRLLHNYDPVENLATFAEVNTWRNTIEVLQWVLEEPVQKMDKSSDVTPA